MISQLKARLTYEQSTFISILI